MIWASPLLAGLCFLTRVPGTASKREGVWKHILLRLVEGTCTVSHEAKERYEQCLHMCEGLPPRPGKGAGLFHIALSTEPDSMGKNYKESLAAERKAWEGAHRGCLALVSWKGSIVMGECTDIRPGRGQRRWE